MTLTELRYLVNLDKERHFGRAAERSFVSQPTLSVALKKLEDELGVILFERNRGEARPLRSGFIVAYGRVPAFIVTLATRYFGRGLGLHITETRAMNLPSLTVTPLEIEAVAGGSVTITISSDIFHDNITGVEPPAFAEVTDITGPRTTIYCKRAGKGDLIIRWNDRAPNADPSGVMIRHVSTLTLYCRHQQGGGK